MKIFFRLTLLSVLSLFLVACGNGTGVKASPYGGTSIPKSIKIGSPYKVSGKTYYPKYDENYKEYGVASWYGPNFHRRQTANGEQYNQNMLTAAHKTLPLPSIVRVTRQDNGKSIIVRINDRGPFVDGRIIDLSKAAAERLNMTGAGTAAVKVEYLSAETEKYIASLGLKKPSGWGSSANSRTEIIPNKSYHYRKYLDSASDSISDSIMSNVKTNRTSLESNLFNLNFTSNMNGNSLSINEVATPSFFDLDFKSSDVGFSKYDYDKALNNESKSSYNPSYKSDPFSVLPDEYSINSYNNSTVSYGNKQNYGYKIQTGSFRDMRNAQRAANNVSSIATAKIAETLVNGDHYYRVLLGPVNNINDAQNLLYKAKYSGINDARIITR